MGPELLEVIPQWSCHHQVMQEVKGKLMVFLPPGIGGEPPATPSLKVAWTWIVVVCQSQFLHVQCTLLHSSRSPSSS